MPVDLEPMPTPYEVANDEVFLTVIVGEGHRGRIKVSLDGVEITKKSSPIDQEPIGIGRELKGKTLQVLTVVTLNEHSPRTKVTYTLEGGDATKKCPSDGPDAGPGDVVDFHAKFRFE